MAETRPSIRVEPLGREVLDGVADPAGDRVRVDVGIVPLFADERPLQGLAGFLDWRSSGMLSNLVREGFCTGAAGDVVLLPVRATLPVARLVLYGLGSSGEFDAERARAAGRTMVDIARRLGAGDALFAMPGRSQARAVSEAVLDGIAETVALLAPDERHAPEAAATLAPADEDAPESVAALAVAAPEDAGDSSGDPDPEPLALTWWVIADPRHVARLRRLLEGPPRPAE